MIPIVLEMILVLEITLAVATILIVIAPMVPVVLNGDQNVEITIIVAEMIIAGEMTIIAEMIIVAETIIVASKSFVSTMISNLRTQEVQCRLLISRLAQRLLPQVETLRLQLISAKKSPAVAAVE